MIIYQNLHFIDEKISKIIFEAKAKLSGVSIFIIAESRDNFDLLIKLICENALESFILGLCL